MPPFLLLIWTLFSAGGGKGSGPPAPGPFFLLLQDGSSHFLLQDGTSRIELQ